MNLKSIDKNSDLHIIYYLLRQSLISHKECSGIEGTRHKVTEP